MAPELPPPVRYKFCPALISWVPTRVGGKVALDPEPDKHGAWVVDHHPSLGFTAYRYVYLTHLNRPRYRLHTNRCRPPEKGAPPPAKADPTAGLKFPKRPPKRVGPFPSLDTLMQGRRMP